MSHWVNHLVHAAAHEKKAPKLGGLVLIVVGLFLTPVLIGIPLVIAGAVKMSRS
jgi:hypothetical protein